MNTRTLWIGAAVLVLAAGCNRNDSTSTGNPRNGDQAKITLTGCLQSGEQGLASSEPNGASRSGEGADRFVLANAMPPGSPSASPSTDSSGPLYVLEGKKDELRQHVGQQVEITGDQQDERDSSDSARGARHIEVDSVRMIAANCATPTR
jgi:hypothetical protein